MSSRRRAACSYSISAAASCMRLVSRRSNLAVSPAMKSQKSRTRARWSSTLIRPTHGAEHLSMYPSRHGRPDWPARL